jgi:4-hydroxybenzoate polyprenyltransferase
MKKYLSLVKFSHTIFAMPFAILGYVLGTQSSNANFSIQQLALVILCMVTARNAAMAFNRYIDSKYDKLNERTSVREIPSGLINEKSAIIFIIFNSLLFIVATYFINTLCFYLSPIALGVILGYSLTKRFTFLCHLILGIGLGLAPVGAYLAVTEYFSIIPIFLGFAVLFWVAGFDIVYALQDEEFDNKVGLFSIPAYFGKQRALTISRILHTICALLIGFSIYSMQIEYPELGILSWIAGVLFACFLIYQHTLVRPNDLSKVNLAFFTSNGAASLIFCSLIILDFYL